ncbi:MAG: UrcA family protein [Pseudomonadota bacterium]|uniref:UrcA family protein n=1 Tax=Sphingomonas sp. ERG5 TaxID=1381597 RepID=UPI00068FB2AB|nr:UrcA family protein [Sphingomonas sp. ERG5]
MLKIILPALLLSVGIPGAAVAQDIHRDIHISHSDLDLRSAAGIKQLDRRISRAIDAVCPDLTAGELGRKMAAYRCRKTMYATVAAQRTRVLAAAAPTAVTFMAAR